MRTNINPLKFFLELLNHSVRHQTSLFIIMRFIDVASGLFMAASTVQAQKMATYVEGTSSVTYKLAYPEAAVAPFDVLLSVEANVNASWVGVAMGGCMLRSPILLFWPNGKGSVSLSSRWAE